MRKTSVDVECTVGRDRTARHRRGSGDAGGFEPFGIPIPAEFYKDVRPTV